ncbi:signal peptidase II [Intestinibacter sp.]
MYELAIILLIGIDQLIKNWALNELKYKGVITVIENVFNLTYVENRGAAFGLFQNNQIIFIVVALLASIAGIYVLHSNKINSKICKFSIVLIIAGAFGNLIDRVRLDFVVDYFDFVFIWNYVFNLADCFIVVGTILLCLCVVLNEDDTKKA